MPSYELITFTPSEAFLADPEAALKPGSEFLKNVDGVVGGYYGIAEEENTAFFIIVWETYEHHKALIDTPGYPQIVGMHGVYGAPPKVVHVNYIDQPTAAIDSAVTEILDMTLKDGKTKEDLAEVVSVIAPKITAEEGCTKPLAWGPTKEEPEKNFYLFLGWTSTKRHFEVVGHESYKTPLGNLFATVDLKMLHTTFKKVA